MAISRRTIDDIKTRIAVRMRALEKEMPPIPPDSKLIEEVLMEAGHGPALKAYKKALEAYDKAAKARDKARNEFAEVLGTTGRYLLYNYDVWTVAGGDFNNPFKEEVAAKKAELKGKTPQGRELERLYKLNRDVGIILELAGSTAEVKEALKEIVEQIGD